MTSPELAQLLLPLIVGISIALMLIRPRNVPEVYWIGAGVIALLLLRLVSWKMAARAAEKALDVCLFLIGMMLLSELAREHGVFDWLSSVAVRRADGSCALLFALVYGVGTLVTIFMSNDATAVVLTPAILTAVRKARVQPLPYLFICAFIANAASFVLPISNPANLVIFRDRMPPLLQWLGRFALPSLASIAVTYAVLRFTQRDSLTHEVMAADLDVPNLSSGGRTTACGIAGMGVV